MKNKLLALFTSVILALGLSSCNSDNNGEVNIKKVDPSTVNAMPQKPGSEAPATNTEKPVADDETSAEMPAADKSNTEKPVTDDKKAEENS